LFFAVVRAHRGLPAFPARRSSDLAAFLPDRSAKRTLSRMLSGVRDQPASGFPGAYRTLAPTLYGPQLYEIQGTRVVMITSPSRPDRKSTRLNSSHVKISYAVFCLK